MIRSIGREAEIGLSSFLKNTLRHPLNTAHLRVVVQLQLKIEKSRVVWSCNYGNCYYLLVDMIKLDFLQQIGLSSFLKNTLRHPLNTAHLRVVVQLQLKIEKSRVVWSRIYGSCYYLLVDMIKLDFLQPKTLIYRIFLFFYFSISISF